MKIVFAAPPFAGHLNPMIPLAQAAKEAGHAVEFVTGERKRAVLEARGFATRGLATAAGDRLEAIANPTSRVGSHPLRLLAQLRQNLALLPAVRDELDAAWRERRPDLVVADSVAVVAGLVAGERGIPWLTTIATPFAIENRRGVPSYCGGWSPGRGPWSVLGELRDGAGRLAVRVFKRSLAWWQREQLTRLGIRSLYRRDGTEAIYSPRAILGFGISELEFARDWPPAFRMIGPVIESPEPCAALEYPSGRRVLVTLGTHLLWAKRGLLAATQRVASELPGVEFVVSLGQPENAGQPVERVARGVSVCPFVPYARDLGAFDAVVHHGGAGITYAAILHGVPSLAVPQDYDQFDFAARIEYHGLGRRARRLNAHDLASILARKSWPGLERMREFALRYRPAESFIETLQGLKSAIEADPARP
jgi:UDP:flavonoid glycosyltransferase YjiC (YdhE family)